MAVTILYGFDTERPWGPDARKSPDAAKAERDTNLELISRIGTLMDLHSAGRTFFILGDYLELSRDAVGSEHLKQVFRPENPLVEMGQHTYNHVILAPIATRPDRVPVTRDVVKSELTRTADLVKTIFGTTVRGIRTPLGYAHRALEASPDVLDTMKESGLEYVSSSLRSKDWAINAPLSDNGDLRQPFRYTNGLIEVPSHGWQDSAFTGTSKTQGTKDFPTTVDEIVEHYTSIISDAQRLSEETDRDIAVGMCMHPWAIKRYDPNLDVIKQILDFSGTMRIKNNSYGQAARELSSL